MQIGVVQTSLGGAGLDKSFGLASKAGAEGVEVCLGAGDLAASGLAELAAALKALRKSTKLEVPGLLLTAIREKLSLIHPKEVPAARSAVRGAIATAARIGAKTLVLPFFGTSAIEVETDIDQAVEAVGELVQDAEDAGVILGLETNLSINRQRFLMDSLGNPGGARIYHDTGNAHARKLDLPTGIRDLGPEAVAGIHLKDVRLAEGRPPQFDLPLGEGDVDFRAVMQALRAIQYDGWLMLETPVGRDPLKALTANVDFARELVQQQPVP